MFKDLDLTGTKQITFLYILYYDKTYVFWSIKAGAEPNLYYHLNTIKLNTIS